MSDPPIEIEIAGTGTPEQTLKEIFAENFAEK